MVDVTDATVVVAPKGAGSRYRITGHVVGERPIPTMHLDSIPEIIINGGGSSGFDRASRDILPFAPPDIHVDLSDIDISNINISMPQLQFDNGGSQQDWSGFNPGPMNNLSDAWWTPNNSVTENIALQTRLEQERMATHFPPGPSISVSINWRATEEFGSRLGHLVELANQSLLAYAKNGAIRSAGISTSGTWLKGATPISRRISRAATTEKAEGIFERHKDGAGKQLAKANKLYSASFKWIERAGWVATGIEEGSYLARTLEEHPDKIGSAVAASAANLIGDRAAVGAGMSFGAWVGGFAAPFTFGMSIPIGAALGGFIGHMIYDGVAKPFVRETLTGIPEPGYPN